MKCPAYILKAKFAERRPKSLEFHVFAQLTAASEVLRFCDSGCGKAGFGGSVSATTDGTGGAGGSCGHAAECSVRPEWPGEPPMAINHAMQVLKEIQMCQTAEGIFTTNLWTSKVQTNMVEFPLVSCVRKFLVEVDQRNHGRARKILGITNKIYIYYIII